MTVNVRGFAFKRTFQKNTLKRSDAVDIGFKGWLAGAGELSPDPHWHPLTSTFSWVLWNLL